MQEEPEANYTNLGVMTMETIKSRQGMRYPTPLGEEAIEWNRMKAISLLRF